MWNCSTSATAACCRSPFTFYRGSALPMAADLASTPASGMSLSVLWGCAPLQLRRIRHCRRGGSCCRSTTSTRRLPAPWEWDVKRLAASFVVACHDDGPEGRSGQGHDHHLRPDLPRGHGRVQQAEDAGILVRVTWRRVTCCAPSRTRWCTGGYVTGWRRSAGRAGLTGIFRSWSIRRRGRSPLIKDQLPTIFHHRGPPSRRRATGRAGRDRRLPRHAPVRISIPVGPATSSGTPPSRWWVWRTSGPAAGCCSSWRRGRCPLPPGQGGAPRPSWSGSPGQDGVPEPRPARGWTAIGASGSRRADMFLGWARGRNRDFFVRGCCSGT